MSLTLLPSHSSNVHELHPTFSWRISPTPRSRHVPWTPTFLTNALTNTTYPLPTTPTQSDSSPSLSTPSKLYESPFHYPPPNPRRYPLLSADPTRD
ncbi:unnamed protein product [Dicrocoelium dendriticum]|nr:unnamed protein product [Dicrocoelium dendriticum]